MALIVSLKDPKIQLILAGDKLVRREWRKRRFGVIPRRILGRFKNGGSPVLFEAANVVMVRLMTDAELDLARKAEEEQQKKAEAAGAGRIERMPGLRIPRGH
jgi:hypothetical protein